MSEKLALFLKVWGLVLVLNQVLFFHAAFAPYAIIAAIPHTFIASLVISYFILEKKKEKDHDED